MAATVMPATSGAVVGEHVRVSPLALLVMAFALMGAYVMLQENGLVLGNWMTVHEFFHDGRHALAFPCH